MRLMSLIALGVIVAGSGAFAQVGAPLTATEMSALLAKGLIVSGMDLNGGREFTSRVNLAADGRLSGTLTVPGHQPVALSGAWKLKGAQLCRTLAPIQPEEICETWVRSGQKQVTVQVDGKNASINRWQ